MKKLLLIFIFNIVFVILIAEESNLFNSKEYNSSTENDSIKAYTPLYLNSYNPIDYILNQPIREMGRYAGILNGVAGVAVTTNSIIRHHSGLSIFFSELDFQFVILGTAGAAIGLPVGLYKGVKYKHDYKKGEIKRFKEPSLSTEWKVINKTDKISVLFFLNYKKECLFFDSILFGSVSSAYSNIINEGWENKLYLGFEDSYSCESIGLFSAYYNLCGGYSEGFYRHQETEIRTIKHNFVSIGHIGLRLNVLDYFYLKLEGEYEYSPFFYHLRSLVGIEEYMSSNSDGKCDLPTKLNYDIGFVVGIDIF